MHFMLAGGEDCSVCSHFFNLFGVSRAVPQSVKAFTKSKRSSNRVIYHNCEIALLVVILWTHAKA